MRCRSFILALVLALCLPFFGAAVRAGPGELDVRFGSAGWRDLPLGYVTGVASLPDGSVVIAGYRWPGPSDAVLVNPMPEQHVMRIAPSGAILWTRSLGRGSTGALLRLRSGRLLVGGSTISSEVGVLTALREDGSLDTAFGSAGRVELSRSQIVTGAGLGLSTVRVDSILELTDGSLLVGATVDDDETPTPFDPAAVAVPFRLSATGQLLGPAAPLVEALRSRSITAMEMLADGRGIWLAESACCLFPPGTVFMSRDGVAPQVPSFAIADAPWTATAIARDEALQRFYALGSRNGTHSLTAIRPDGTPDAGFGVAGTGRVTLASPTALGRLWVDSRGTVVAAVSEGRPDWDEPELLKLVTARAGVTLEAWDSAGRVDPSFHVGRELLLAGPHESSSARVVGIAPAEPGLLWIAASVSSESEDVVRLAKLQTSAGSGPGAIGFEVSTVRLTEQGPSKSVRVVRSGGSAGAVSVRYEIMSTEGGLVAASGTLSWPDGDAASRSIQLVPRDDSLLQGERSQTVRLSDAQGGALLAGDSLTVTIEDDDVLAGLRVAAAASQIRAGEKARFLLTLDRPVTGPVIVSVLVGDSADDSGAPLFLSKNNSGRGVQTLVWNPGESGQQVFTMGTNATSDASYAVDLQLRLATRSGWLVRTPANGVALGTTIKVVGGAAPPGLGSSGGGAAVQPSPSPTVSQGGGFMGCWSLALLGSLGVLRLARRRIARALSH